MGTQVLQKNCVTKVILDQKYCTSLFGHHPLTGKEKEEIQSFQFFFFYFQELNSPIRGANCWLFSLVFQFFIKLEVQFFLVIRETSHLRKQHTHTKKRFSKRNTVHTYRVHNSNTNRVLAHSNAIANIFWVSDNKPRAENSLNDGLNVC